MLLANCGYSIRGSTSTLPFVCVALPFKCVCSISLEDYLADLNLCVLQLVKSHFVYNFKYNYPPHH